MTPVMDSATANGRKQSHPAQAPPAPDTGGGAASKTSSPAPGGTAPGGSDPVDPARDCTVAGDTIPIDPPPGATALRYNGSSHPAPGGTDPAGAPRNRADPADPASDRTARGGGGPPGTAPPPAAAPGAAGTGVGTARSIPLPVEDIYRAIFDSSEDYLVLVDPNGRIKDCSMNFCTLTGLGKGEIIGRMFFEFQEVQEEDVERYVEILERLVAGGTAEPFEVRLGKEGENGPWARVTMTVLKEGGMATAILAQLRNIHDTKITEAFFHETRDKYRELADLLPQSIFETDLWGNFTFVNRAALETFGYTKDDLSGGLTALHMIADGDRERAGLSIQRILRGEDVPSHEYTAVRKDGTTFPIQIFATPIMKDGKPHGLRGLIVDITDMQNAQEALRKQTGLVERIMATSPMGIVVMDRTGCVTYANQYVLEKMGVTAEEMAKHSPREPMWCDLDLDGNPLPPEVLPFSIVSRTVAPVYDVRHAVELRNGERYLISVNAAPLLNERGEFDGIVSTIEDITEREEVEKARWESEEKYRSVVENANEAICVAQDGHLRYVNPKSVELTGYSVEELTTMPFVETIHPEDREMVMDNHGMRLRGESVSPKYTFRIVTKDGEVRWVEIGAVVIEWEGRPATLNFLNDITERKKAEDALKDSEEKYRLHFENVTDVIYTVDRDFRIRDLSPSVETVLGYRPEELIGRRITDLNVMTPESMERAMERAVGVLDGEVHGPLEYTFIAKDGTHKIGDVNGAPLFKGGKLVGIISVARDVTERKRMEARILEERNRAELYLDLLCHDVNNMNQGIMTYAELLLMEEGLDEKRRGYIQDSLKQSVAISDLTHNVGRLSELHAQDLRPTALDALELLGGAADRVKRSDPERPVHIRYRVPPGRIMVTGLDLLQDVFSNILGNAVKYDKHGQCVVDVIVSRDEGGGWRFEFRDNGPGVPDASKQKVFERLERGDRSVKGSGLGLTIVREVVKFCGGRVWVEDRVPGDHTRGSNFVVVLPGASV